LVVSTALLFSGVGIVPSLLARFVFPNLVRDSREMERVVTASDVDWTVVRPPRLTEGDRTERYRVEDDGLPRGGSVISRADVAHFMLDEVEQRAHVRKIVGVCR
jgi:putative NADH-flavin reductase